MDSMFHLWRISLARSMMIFRRASRMSSILSRVTLAAQGTDAVDAFNACCDEGCGDAVEAGGYGYGAGGSVVFRMQVDFYSADASSLLELAEVKFWSEESLCLAKNCAYNVGFLYDTFNFKSSVYNVLYRKCLGCSRKCALPIVSYILTDYVNRIKARFSRSYEI